MYVGKVNPQCCLWTCAAVAQGRKALLSGCQPAKCPVFDQRGFGRVGLPWPDLIKTPLGLPNTDQRLIKQLFPHPGQTVGPRTKQSRLCQAQAQGLKAQLPVHRGPVSFLDFEQPWQCQSSGTFYLNQHRG